MIIREQAYAFASEMVIKPSNGLIDGALSFRNKLFVALKCG